MSRFSIPTATGPSSVPTHSGVSQKSETPWEGPWTSSKILRPRLTAACLSLYPAESFFPSLPP